ncbi:hypothetical protein BKA70DRAFT_1444686 [Coprinopsis sp. MPI-PUGE-AT-0042]|nr:hypothetical protein BKA70DRAFT_1444686 [Coprinopsis sp. MPI-PUGE-AT-0042]
MAGSTTRGEFRLFWVLILGLVTLGVAKRLQHSILRSDDLPACLFFLSNTLNVIYRDTLEANMLISEGKGKSLKYEAGLPANTSAMRL